MAAGGRRSSVAESWQLKPKPWVRLPAAPLIFRALCRFKGLRTVTAQIVFQSDTITIGYQTIEESRPSDSSPCCDYACDLSLIKYAIFVGIEVAASPVPVFVDPQFGTMHPLYELDFYKILV